jgi:TetR/AcrR family transcriptional regulator of autoinduction and epiphytic fitness
MAAKTLRHRIRGARRDLYRQLVCEAAERIFAANGFAGARVEDISRASGVSVGTIYRVFPGKKRQIYHAIQERRGIELIGTTRARGLAAWQEKSDLIDAMLAAVAALVEYLTQYPDYLRLVLREEQAWGVGPRRRTRTQTAMWHEGIEGAVMAMRQGIAQGTLVDDDPEAMARVWVAMQQAQLGYWLEQGRRTSAAQLSDRLQRQFLRAFCRPEVLATRMSSRTPMPGSAAPGLPPMARGQRYPAPEK